VKNAIIPNYSTKHWIQRQPTWYQIGNATRVPENPGNPPVFKPVNRGLCAVKNPGFTGLI